MASSRRLRAVPDPIDSFLEQLGEMPISYLQCRDTAHPWEVESKYRIVDTRKEKREPRQNHVKFVERVIRCSRCQMSRSDAYEMQSFRGHTVLAKIDSRYTPPPGYYVKGVTGMGIDSRQLVRGVQFERVQAQSRGNTA